MDYFHTDSPTTLDWLARVVARAANEGRSLRLLTEGNMLKVKLGEGAWTAPIDSTPDPFRDLSTQSCRKCNLFAEGKWDGAAGVNHTCGQ